MQKIGAKIRKLSFQCLSTTVKVREDYWLYGTHSNREITDHWERVAETS